MSDGTGVHILMKRHILMRHHILTRHRILTSCRILMRYHILIVYEIMICAQVPKKIVYEKIRHIQLWCKYRSVTQSRNAERENSNQNGTNASVIRRFMIVGGDSSLESHLLALISNLRLLHDFVIVTSVQPQHEEIPL